MKPGRARALATVAALALLGLTPNAHAKPNPCLTARDPMGDAHTLPNVRGALPPGQSNTDLVLAQLTSTGPDTVALVLEVVDLGSGDLFQQHAYEAEFTLGERRWRASARLAPWADDFALFDSTVQTPVTGKYPIRGEVDVARSTITMLLPVSTLTEHQPRDGLLLEDFIAFSTIEVGTAGYSSDVLEVTHRIAFDRCLKS